MSDIKYSSTKEMLIGAKVPAMTDSYSPIPHKDVIEFTLEHLDKAGMKLKSEAYSMAKDAKQAMGFYRIEGAMDKDMGIELAWQNSYDKSLSLKWAIGGRVFICSNGMVSGDIGTFKRKHTGDALNEYKETVIRYVGDAHKKFQELLRDKERMKEIEITKRISAELIGRMFIEDKIINTDQLNIIKRELDHSSFDYGVKGTLWNLYNNCTVALKEAHPSLYLTQHMDLHKLIKEEFAI